ncbi:FAD-dependent oxidoreductase [Candidatus Symbiopectobacterium sp. 'North America']|uniref:FAD-dependent oxidoreductase n=1 Tax=Candidatus Symbiopectobacterium sp. 'North America' TaxID=2794574 RepID=UPI0018CB16B2|nr:FAD-dependent oxidoreductase [Candidatus Symbiopectobacterium sp. 'North America']MBG6244560.1 FAD-dependent oxidoreductase [Candidatus Symbiopectobacterium sp. 'North America']
MLQNNYDVVVIGGGVAAAIGAAQAGKKALLVERSSYLGGQATHCSIPTYDGFFTRHENSEQIAGGVASMVMEKLKQYHGCGEPLRSPWGNVMFSVNNEMTKIVLEELVMQSGAHLLLNSQLCDVVRNGNTIKSITLLTDGGKVQITAQAFVDASGDGNLVYLSGAEHTSPDVENLQFGSLLTRFGGVASDADVSPAALRAVIAQGKAAGITPLSKDSGFAMRIVGTEDVIAILCNEKVNPLDADSLTQGQIRARKQAMAYLDTFKRFLPGFEQAYVINTGPHIGIRESRHAVGEYALTGDDVVNAATARGCWPIERHTSANKMQVYTWIKDDGYYEIPLRSLKSINIDNLWLAGRIISCDSEAFASVRVMGTAFLTGHAAGIAASMKNTPTENDIAAIQCELKRQGALI